MAFKFANATYVMYRNDILSLGVLHTAQVITIASLKNNRIESGTTSDGRPYYIIKVSYGLHGISSSQYIQFILCDGDEWSPVREKRDRFIKMPLKTIFSTHPLVNMCRSDRKLILKAIEIYNNKLLNRY